MYFFFSKIRPSLIGFFLGFLTEFCFICSHLVWLAIYPEGLPSFAYRVSDYCRGWWFHVFFFTDLSTGPSFFSSFSFDLVTRAVFSVWSIEPSEIFILKRSYWIKCSFIPTFVDSNATLRFTIWMRDRSITTECAIDNWIAFGITRGKKNNLWLWTRISFYKEKKERKISTESRDRGDSATKNSVKTR